MLHFSGEIKVAAKVNLTLNITGKRGNLHTLDMVLSSIDLYDELSFCENDLGAVRIKSESRMPSFDSARFNAAMQTVADKFTTRFGGVGCDIKIVKNIPLGAGLGGSSASIAGIVYALEAVLNAKNNEQSNIDIKINNGTPMKSETLKKGETKINNGTPTKGETPTKDIEFLLSLGSDVPYMCSGGMARVCGVGESVTPLEFAPLHFVILASVGGVGSREAYAIYDKLEKDMPLDAEKHGNLSVSCTASQTSYGALQTPYEMQQTSGGVLSASLCNDLEIAASMLSSDIKMEKFMLKDAGAKHIVMSGSGSAMIAVCKSKSEAEQILAKVKALCAENGFDGFISIQQSVPQKQALLLCKQ